MTINKNIPNPHTKIKCEALILYISKTNPTINNNKVIRDTTNNKYKCVFSIYSCLVGI